ncbi:hypothetical protein pEaSNUABM37_00181 [Erwinia phage pEa_SNUABM_37]|nr:hypothetical protein pEaSNUABM37_00181 [Erwinia phage pEa_SNUABM_37]QXO10651.1 hypothetical protein pEaSNUABM48_00181 [Erwinia phage pEa_SNUABM_48]
MSEVSVKTAFRRIDDLFYVKNLEMHIPGYFINARLIHLDEASTNSTYDVYVARNLGEGRLPGIVRDWTMRGFYQPRGDGASLKHRHNQGGTIYTLGSTREHVASGNLINAIFDALLGYCDVSDLATIDSYKVAARAMYTAGVVAGVANNQYQADIVTPYEHLRGTRVWFINADDFMYGHTTWTLALDGFTRMTHRESVINTTYRDIDALFTAKAVEITQASKAM